MTNVRDRDQTEGVGARRDDAKQRLARVPTHLDLAAVKRQIQSENEWQQNGRNQYALFHSGALRVGYFGFKAGTGIEDHKVNGHLMIHVLEGQVEVSGGGQAPETVGANQFVGMDGMKAFTIKAHEESYAIIAFVQADGVGEPARGNEQGTQIIT